MRYGKKRRKRPPNSRDREMLICKEIKILERGCPTAANELDSPLLQSSSVIGHFDHLHSRPSPVKQERIQKAAKAPSF